MAEKPGLKDQWTREQLTGKSVSFKGLSDDAVKEDPKKGKKDATKLDPMLWGQPGHLTEEEADVFFKFKEEIAKRDDEFRSTIFSFTEEEGEVWALCRWLRARKFVYEDVIKMIEEATETRKEAKANDFYPDPVDSLGCEASLYFHHYPQLYTGFAKNGAPVFISKPGVLNVDAVECITTLDGIVKFHWYIMMRDFAARLLQQKKNDPSFKRFECFCVLDLAHLTVSQLTSKALAIIKEQSAIDSVCFPETMSKMFIINGPRFFGASWKLIKGWLDPRTAGKIEVISDRKTWEKRMLEFVDEDQLPSDYGGKGPNTDDTIAKEAFKGSLKAMHTEVIYLRGSGSASYSIKQGEEVEVHIYTRSVTAAKFSVMDADDKAGTPWIQDVEVVHSGTSDVSEIPSRKQLTEEGKRIKGPANIKVKAESAGSRWSSQNFLVAFLVYPIGS